MARILTAQMADAIRRQRPLALLVDIDHPDGRARFWSGIGILHYGGYSWTGAGLLGGITPVRRTSDLSVQEVMLSLSGVPPESATWLTANVRNREAAAWLACVVDDVVVPDPIELLDMRLDYQTFTVDDDGVATISLSAQSGFYTLSRAMRDVWSEQDQKTRYPTDTGFDLLPTLQNQEVKWTAS
jgi:hypothetical protein